MNESVESDALVIPSSMIFIGGRFLILQFHLFIFRQQIRAFNLLTRNKPRITGIDDLYAAQHLPHNYLDVLVIDLDALKAINILNLVSNITCERLDPQQAENIMRIRGPVDDALPLVHDLTVVGSDMLVLGNQILMRNPIQIGNDQALFAFGILAERYDACNLRQHTRILRRASLEQFRDTRQDPR